MKTFLKSLVAVLLVAMPMAARAGTVTVKGSDTMVILGQRWAEEFMKKTPATKVQVTGGGSGTGLAALQNGTTDIAMSSREMKEAEGEKLRVRWSVAPGKEGKGAVEFRWSVEVFEYPSPVAGRPRVVRRRESSFSNVSGARDDVRGNEGA